ncbi:MAG TPA: YihY/virulence factor BrkB family protein [Actinomycetes bacterium]|nr:YihY/virulence factor BrkB family protein [Actinomycetes bacterium]
MSGALGVPETSEHLDGHDAREAISQVHWQTLLKRAFQRLRTADGFSHARASAFAFALLLVEGTIAVIGLAVAVGSPAFSRTVTAVAETIAPGPAGQLLTSAIRQAQEAAVEHQYTALTIGLVAALVTGTTAMGQFERSCNRVYGIDTDRPTAHKYGRALVLTVTIGLASALATLTMVLGRPIAESIESSSLSILWLWGRWPLAVGVLVIAMTLLLKLSPNRRQPALSWLVYGAAISVTLIVAASLILAAFFWWSTTFGDTYGPLAGMIGLLLWCFAMAAAGLYGIAITAQLESELAKRGLELTVEAAETILTR